MMSIENFTNSLESVNMNQATTVKKRIATLSKDQVDCLNDCLDFLEYFFLKCGRTVDDIGLAWNNIVKVIIKEKYYFIKNREYRCKKLEEAVKYVYSNEKLMFDYNAWLLLTNVINDNHIRLFDFFSKNLLKYKGNKYLEIGPGHGLLFYEAIKLNQFNEYVGIDISKSSLKMTNEFLTYQNSPSIYKLEELNLFDIPENTKYDFITCGEVLEHVESPDNMIKKISSLLSENGVAYISTALNSPAPDHIYLFDNGQEVEELLHLGGLEVIDKIEIPMETFSLKKYPSVTEYSVGYLVRKCSSAV